MPSRRAIAAGPKFLAAAQARHLDGIDRRLAALVDAARLGGVDPLERAEQSRLSMRGWLCLNHVSSLT
jgi:hypothetical protein